MPYDPSIHHRRSIRLKGYDYAQFGAYFITLVVRGRECALGDVIDGVAHLSDIGRIVEARWSALPAHFEYVQLDEWTIMPNHVHGIIWIDHDIVGAKHVRPPANASPQHPNGTQPGSLAAVVQNFKSVSTREINQLHNAPGQPFWQRNYHERIIRNDRELNAIRQYIADNPLKWALDRDNPIKGGTYVN